MRITLDLDHAEPPQGRARLSPSPRQPPGGAGASGVSASVRFSGWLGLIKGVSQLLRIWGSRALVVLLIAVASVAGSAAEGSGGLNGGGVRAAPVDGTAAIGAGEEAREGAAAGERMRVERWRRGGTEARWRPA